MFIELVQESIKKVDIDHSGEIKHDIVNVWLITKTCGFLIMKQVLVLIERMMTFR
jgi:hypothetical protein